MLVIFGNWSTCFCDILVPYFRLFVQAKVALLGSDFDAYMNDNLQIDIQYEDEIMQDDVQGQFEGWLPQIPVGLVF